MNRRIAAFAIAAVAVLGLTACSGSSDTAEETPSSAASSAPAEEQNSDQSIAEACASASAQIQDATSSLTSLDVSSASADPQGTVDTFTESVDAIGAAADSLENEEVKAAVTAVYEDFGTMRDLLQRVLVDQDQSAASELGTVSSDVQASALAVSELCAG